MFAINMYAVVGGTVASIILGFIWYGPIFGKAWLALMNIGEGIDQSNKGMIKRYSIMTVGTILTNIVLAYITIFVAVYYNITGIRAGICSALFAWVGFVAPITLGSVLWENKSWKLWLINNGYNLLSLVISGLIIGVLMQ